MLIKLPAFSLVLLIGPSGAGKSHFAAKHFLATEVLSSDRCRALVSDDENDMEATEDAFAILHEIAGKRLKRKLLTVIDATNVQPDSRKSLVALAREYHCLACAIVFDLPENLCRERNALREDRDMGNHVIRNQRRQMRRSMKFLKKEGFRYIYTFSTLEEVDAVSIKRKALWTDKTRDSGPFDIIGDIHGCLDECLALLGELGYEVAQYQDGTFDVKAPEGRRVIFLGDLVDRGPDSPGVLRLVMHMVDCGLAYCIPGNHDMKLLKKLRGKRVNLAHGLAETMQQLEGATPLFLKRVESFLDGLISHYVFDQGRLVVAHAGMKESLQGRASGKVRDFALYGETTGETDEFGLPVRYQWASDYRGKALVVYGHTPVPEVEWLNNTVCLDTGCVFGGALTALRYPEKELVQIPAAKVYSAPIKPIGYEAPVRSAQQVHDDLLYMEDVSGKRSIETGLRGRVTILEGNAAAAIEVMARFAADPRWLIYMPPTMSPSTTTKRPGLLEHPDEAFSYYQNKGVKEVICEQKHMGSRAVVVLCRDPSVVTTRFGIEHKGETLGICLTRTGRRFFQDLGMEQRFLERLRDAMEASELWEQLNTDWICLDGELMPWSAKAQLLLDQQYAPVATAAAASLDAVEGLFSQALARGLPLEALHQRTQQRAEAVEGYTVAYQHYCWPVHSLDDLTFAPFHIMATEGKVHTEESHVWHMQTLAELCYADDKLLLPTPYMSVDLLDAGSCAAAVTWWEELTAKGGEGMVVKPHSFLAYGKSGILQPAIKCRGREYLRIIYGPEYTLAENLERLRERGVSRKRSLALREFALGVEGLRRFVEGAPLRMVHECAFGVLALESEAVDPRL